MFPSLVEDVGVAREIVVDRQFTHVTVRGIVEGVSSVAFADLLLVSYSSTTSGTS
uniref:Uncharacterized protein n=1 Tax=Peronospora matthiolae TaxID=2874970 RepID=A0AAV1VM36_9STRA